MDLTQLIDAFRHRSDDEILTAVLVSDERAAEFASEADLEALYRARLVFEDNVLLTIEEGVRDYDLDPLIFDLVTVTLNTSERTLLPVDHVELVRNDPGQWRTRTGTPTHFLRSGARLSLYPVPVLDEVATLAGYRTPLEPLTGGSDEPETPLEHRRHLIDWMLWRAYSTKDTEIRDEQRAINHLALFEAHFGKRESAKTVRRQQERRRNTVRYGGIR